MKCIPDEVLTEILWVFIPGIFLLGFIAGLWVNLLSINKKNSIETFNEYNHE